MTKVKILNITTAIERERERENYRSHKIIFVQTVEKKKSICEPIHHQSKTPNSNSSNRF